jgi:hypothetical protein
LREPNLGKTNPRISLTYSLAICFAPSLADSFIFLTLTRLVVVFTFVNFSFALFTPPPLGDFHRFNEVNSALLGHMAAFNPKNSFLAFDRETLVRLAEFYLDDFDSNKLDDLSLELVIYIDNVRADRRFDNLDGIVDLTKLMVQTNKHITFSLVYQLLKLVLILPVATS